MNYLGVISMPRKPQSAEIKRIKQLSSVCKSCGIARLRVDNIEIELSKAVGGTPGSFKYEQAKLDYLNKPERDMPPDDVMLFAATPHMDEILAERKAAKKR